jgi:LPXTG-site transpeptidase (sortase) family protein
MHINQNQPEFTVKEVALYHKELAKAEAVIRRKIFAHRSRNRGAEILHFSLISFIIFCVTFVGLNFSAYKAQAKFLLTNLFITENTNKTLIHSQSKQILIPKKINKNYQTKRTNSNRALQPINLAIAPPENRIIIPQLKISAPIREVENVDLASHDWEIIEKQIQTALEKGVVHFPGTAKEGENGNTFITGHSSYYPFLPGNYKNVFALLPRIKIGAKIDIWQDQQKYTYQVTETREVSPKATEILAPTSDSQLTLMTCTPVGTTLKRFIVIAKPSTKIMNDKLSLKF